MLNTRTSLRSTKRGNRRASSSSGGTREREKTSVNDCARSNGPEGNLEIAMKAASAWARPRARWTPRYQAENVMVRPVGW